MKIVSFTVEYFFSTVGVMYVNKTAPTMNEINHELSVVYGGDVEKGGKYKPKDCIPVDKVHIVF